MVQQVNASEISFLINTRNLLFGWRGWQRPCGDRGSGRKGIGFAPRATGVSAISAHWQPIFQFAHFLVFPHAWNQPATIFPPISCGPREPVSARFRSAGRPGKHLKPRIKPPRPARAGTGASNPRPTPKSRLAGRALFGLCSFRHYSGWGFRELCAEAAGALLFPACQAGHKATFAAHACAHALFAGHHLLATLVGGQLIVVVFKDFHPIFAFRQEAQIDVEVT